MTLHRVLHDDDGVALAEFAVVLPLFLVLVFGILDFGRAFTYWINETHLASQAARYAAVNKNPGVGGETLQQYIQKQGTTRELRDGVGSVVEKLTVSICFPNSPSGTPVKGDPVRVTTRARYRWLSVLDLDAATTEIKSSSTMRLEATPTNFTADGPCST